MTTSRYEETANRREKRKVVLNGSSEHRKEIHEKISRILTIIEECKILESGEPTFVITTRSGAGTRDPLFLNPLVSDLQKKDKTEAKRTKPNTE
nr:hypothetical protein [Tanacetum cinerariifolium]